MAQTATADTATTTTAVVEPSHQKTEQITIKVQPVVTQVASKDLDSAESKVREYFKDVPILAEVARCESNFSQYDKNGNLVRGIVNNSDVGVMQINEFYHTETARKKGLDLHTIEGNMAYARDLYEREGLKPWAPSKACWGTKGDIAQR